MDFRPPDLDGIAHSSQQLVRDIAFISFWNIVSAGIFAGCYFVVARKQAQTFGLIEGGKNGSGIVRLTVIHWIVIFLPTLWLAHNFWVLHVRFVPPIMPSI